jgi:NAD(P)-dependent dehydrogenase (short-subunit alcohol dehydrogenase family)
MKNKTVIVTGGTNGIGEVTARELAQMGAHVVIISRSAEKCQAAVRAIQSATGNPNVEYIAADLSSLKEIHRAADEFKAKHSKLHVLVNNAGAYIQSFQRSIDGYEMTFALNHLSYFLLTMLLLDTLKATAAAEGEARIINVSSDAHQMVQKLNFDTIPRQSGAGFPAYGESKYMNVIFTYELAHRLAGTGVTANVLHPGFVRSGFGKNCLPNRVRQPVFTWHPRRMSKESAANTSSRKKRSNQPLPRMTRTPGSSCGY